MLLRGPRINGVSRTRERKEKGEKAEEDVLQRVACRFFLPLGFPLCTSVASVVVFSRNVCHRRRVFRHVISCELPEARKQTPHPNKPAAAVAVLCLLAKCRSCDAKLTTKPVKVIRSFRPIIVVATLARAWNGSGNHGLATVATGIDATVISRTMLTIMVILSGARGGGQ